MIGPRRAPRLVSERLRRAGPSRLPTLLLVLATLAATGCGAPPAVDRTDGLALQLRLRTPDNAYAFYRVDIDGTLGFGGGLRAMANETTWSGPLTDEEIARLHEAVGATGWLDAAPPDEERDSRLPEYRVRLERKTEDATLVREFVTNDERARLVIDVLEPAAMRRHDAFMQSLPQPKTLDQGPPASPSSPPAAPPSVGPGASPHQEMP